MKSPAEKIFRQEVESLRFPSRDLVTLEHGVHLLSGREIRAAEEEEEEGEEDQPPQRLF